MIILLILATLVSTIIYLFNKEITTEEFLKMTFVTILSVLMVYGISIIPFPNDIMYKSGRLISTVYHPYFVEEYTVIHTVSNGKTTYTYTTTEYAKHQPYYTKHDTLGRTWTISKREHEIIKKDFHAKQRISRPNKCTHGGRFYKGDPYLYTYRNDSNTYNFPTNQIVSWHNPIKNKQTLFYNKTKEVKTRYPLPLSDFKTSRYNPKYKAGFTMKDWDILNTKVYETKGVNLVFVKVEDMNQALNLQRYWLNGKENDIVICVVGDNKKPEMVKTFGWVKSNRVLTELDAYILENGITKNNFSEIYNIINKYYEPYDFKNFSYLDYIPKYTIFVALLVAIGVSVFMYNIYANNYDRRR